MPNAVDLKVDLKAVAASAPRRFTLDDDFFSSLEQEEISGGHVTATVEVKETAGNCFTVRLSVEGRVTVACDRCLDPVSLPVAAADEFKVLDKPTDDDPDSRVLEAGAGYTCDLSWDVYELAALSLPVQRVHEAGGCNEEMAAKLKSLRVGESSAEAAEEN